MIVIWLHPQLCRRKEKEDDFTFVISPKAARRGLATSSPLTFFLPWTASFWSLNTHDFTFITVHPKAMHISQPKITSNQSRVKIRFHYLLNLIGAILFNHAPELLYLKLKRVCLRNKTKTLRCHLFFLSTSFSCAQSQRCFLQAAVQVKTFLRNCTVN